MANQATDTNKIIIEFNGQTIFLERQPWDSQVLERECARITDIHAASINLIQLPAELERRGFEYVTARFEIEKANLIDGLLNVGFERVDGIISFQLDLTQTTNFPDVPEIRQATATDAQEVAELAARTFKYSRFHNDPVITDAQARKVHYEWAKNSCLGQAADIVWVMVQENRIVGFSTVAVKGDVGFIVLVCVDQDYSGRGIAGRLTQACCNWIKRKSLRAATVQTQDVNLAAQSVYIRQGFREVQRWTTVRWAKNAESAKLIKLATGSFLALETAFFEEMSKLAQVAGANIDEVWNGASSDARIESPNFNPLKNSEYKEQLKDLQKLVELARNKGFEMKLLEAVLENDSVQPGLLSKILALVRSKLASHKNPRSSQ